MRLAFNIFVIAFIAHVPALAQRVSLALPETKKSIVLSFEPAPGAQGNFRSIYIKSEGKSFAFRPKNPIARVPESAEARQQRGFWYKVPGLQLHPSRYFFIGEYAADSKPHTLLFFISEGGASDAAPLFVLGFSEDGTPYKVLERSEFDLYGFQPTGNGDALIIGKATMSQIMSGDGSNGSKTPYATTYDPYSIFVVHNLSRAEYSLTESRKYNQKNYVWAGPSSREDYAVLYNLSGHPKPMGAPVSRIDALLGANRTPAK